MLILGLLLLACTAAFTGLAISDNLSGGPDYSVSVLGNHIATMNSLAIFCAGLALALIFGLGVLMVMTSLGLRRRRSHKRTEVRQAAAYRAGERDDPAAGPVSPESGYRTPTGDPSYPRDPRARDIASNRDRDPARPEDSAATRDPSTPRHRHSRHLFG